LYSPASIGSEESLPYKFNAVPDSGGNRLSTSARRSRAVGGTALPKHWQTVGLPKAGSEKSPSYN
jgi:hypothetical protein